VLKPNSHKSPRAIGDRSTKTIGAPPKLLEIVPTKLCIESHSKRLAQKRMEWSISFPQLVFDAQYPKRPHLASRQSPPLFQPRSKPDWSRLWSSRHLERFLEQDSTPQATYSGLRYQSTHGANLPRKEWIHLNRVRPVVGLWRFNRKRRFNCNLFCWVMNDSTDFDTPDT